MDYCPYCETELVEGGIFCKNCGAVIEKKPLTSAEPAKETMYAEKTIQQPQPIQPQQYATAEKTPKKTKTKLIAAVVVIIAIAILIVALLFVLKGTNDSSSFVGTWDVNMSYGGTGSSSWTFYENGSLMTSYPSSIGHPSIIFEKSTMPNSLTVTSIEESDYSSVQWGTYEAKDGKLTLKSSTSPTLTMDYKFSGDSTCTLTTAYLGYPISVVMTKTSETNTNQTTTAIEWKDINITVNPYETNPHWDWINLSRSSVYYSGSHAPSEWGKVTVGDTIYIGEYGTTNVYVDMSWVSDNSMIDSWFFEGSSTNNQPQEPSLIGYWNFDEGSGSTLYDQSGNNNVGYVSDANWVSGISGTALEFNNTDIVDGISSYFDNSISSSFTISSWVYWHGPNSYGRSSIIFDGRGSTGGFYLFVGINGTVLLNVQKNLQDVQTFCSNTAILENTWTHITAVFNYTSKTAYIYINGEVNSASTITNPYYESYDSPAIGNNHWEDGNWAPFNGIIDELRVYNYALDSVEVSNIP